MCVFRYVCIYIYIYVIVCVFIYVYICVCMCRDANIISPLFDGSVMVSQYGSIRVNLKLNDKTCCSNIYSEQDHVEQISTNNRNDHI